MHEIASQMCPNVNCRTKASEASNDIGDKLRTCLAQYAQHVTGVCGMLGVEARNKTFS